MRIFFYLINFIIFNQALALDEFQENFRLYTLNQVEYYFNNVTTMQADFEQTAGKEVISVGKFFLSRPGKLRWQYAPPTPIIITINKSTLAYYDQELDQLSYVAANNNLSSFLTKKQISFKDKSINIEKVFRNKDIIEIKLYSKQNRESQYLTMIFSTKPIELKGLQIIDINKQEINISFKNLLYNIPIDQKTFTNPKYIAP